MAGEERPTVENLDKIGFDEDYRPFRIGGLRRGQNPDISYLQSEEFRLESVGVGHIELRVEKQNPEAFDPHGPRRIFDLELVSYHLRDESYYRWLVIMFKPDDPANFEPDIRCFLKLGGVALLSKNERNIKQGATFWKWTRWVNDEPFNLVVPLYEQLLGDIKIRFEKDTS